MARWDRFTSLLRRRGGEHDDDQLTPAWMETTNTRLQGWRREHVNSTAIKNALVSLLPGFLTSRAYTHQRELGPTSYLIALRGVAALIVVFQHFGINEKVMWLKEPFVGILGQGTAMVCVFFIISGYSLAYKPMTLIHQQESPKLLSSLAGSVFRRYLRLYVPCLIAMFLSYVFVVTRLAENAYAPYLGSAKAQTLDFLHDALTFSDPFKDVPGYFSAWTFKSRYLFQLWTIPVEFRGSLAVFLTLTGVAMLTTRTRTIILSVMVVLAFLYKVVYIGLFLVGIIMAEYSILRSLKEAGTKVQAYAPIPASETPESTPLPTAEMMQIRREEVAVKRQSMELAEMSSSSRSGSVSSEEEMTKKEQDAFSDDDEADEASDLDISEDLEMADASWPRQEIGLRHHIWRAAHVIGVTVALTIGVFLLSASPWLRDDTPAVFKQIRQWLPPIFWNPEEEGFGNEEFWYGIGSILLVGAIDASSFLQRPLRTPFLQYLGDLSFGMYVLHPLLVYTIDGRIMEKWYLKQDTAWAFVPKMLVSLPILFLISDWFASMDKALVNWGYRLQKRYFQKWT